MDQSATSLRDVWRLLHIMQFVFQSIRPTQDPKSTGHHPEPAVDTPRGSDFNKAAPDKTAPVCIALAVSCAFIYAYRLSAKRRRENFWAGLSRNFSETTKRRHPCTRQSGALEGMVLRLQQQFCSHLDVEVRQGWRGQCLSESVLASLSKGEGTGWGSHCSHGTRLTFGKAWNCDERIT